MRDNVQIGGLYKIKEGKSLCTEEILSPYVRFLDYAINPLKEDDVYIEFIYVYKEDLGLTTRIFPVKILPYDTFFEYFELELTSKEVNNLIFDLRSSEHEQTDRN